MNKLEFTESMAYLGLAYGKAYTQAELEQAYDFLSDYSDHVFTQTVKRIIRKYKFLPKITEIISECEKTKNTTQYEVVEFMLRSGYFKSPLEYEKTVKFLNRNTVPAWLLEDLRKYARLMKQEQISFKQQLIS